MAVAVFTLLLVGFAFAQNGPDDANCLPGTWLPEGADWTHCSEPGAPYDGSKVPDCSAFHGQVNTTSFFHVHEYGEVVSPEFNLTMCRLWPLLGVQSRGPVFDAMRRLQPKPWQLPRRKTSV